MPLTRSFRESIQEQLANAIFRREFLRGTVANMLQKSDGTVFEVRAKKAAAA